MGDRHLNHRALALAAWCAGLGLVLALRLVTTSALPEGLDAALFIRGVERYALSEGRPHWPGYPIYVWAARVARLITGSAGLALHLVSVAASTATLVPIAMIARRWARRAGLPPGRAALASGLSSTAWLVLPFSWVTGSQMLSDPLGLLAGLCLLWLCDIALTREENAERSLAAAGMVAGVLLGIRLAYVGLVAPLVYAAMVLARRTRPFSTRPLAVAALSACAGVLPWLCWQVGVEGTSLLTAGRTTLRGHFAWWGGSLTTEPDAFERVAAVWHGWVVQGLGTWEWGREWARLPLTVCWGATLVAGAVRLARIPRARALAALWIGPYVVYTFLALDIAQPRYGLPAAGLACIVAGLGAPSRAWACAVVMAAWLAAAGSISLPLAMRQREVPPIEHQLVDFVRASGGAPATVLDRRGELLADLLDGAVERAVVREPGLAARTRELEAAGRRVYSTAPAPDRPQDWRPVARFCWNEPLDLLAAKEVWLFLHGPGAPPGPPPECYRFTASASTIR